MDKNLSMIVMSNFLKVSFASFSSTNELN